ncbi:MAG: hydroxyacylglutathione hydrolase [Acidimicrobiaceae bacterium]|jgi:glyoxylase-like metal-dependent hydrolase (beta-lactamase superfamily II)/rhodanese-related sulfurtransferase
MHFTQHYLSCLSHASYLIGDTTTGRAVVVDPQRDISAYLSEAAEAGLEIAHVIETHIHADFVSGHLELAAATGADICYGARAEIEFPIHPLRDGDRLILGEVVLEIRATPGHTPESISVVIWEHADDIVPYGVLTGDTLFVGDVGRPDLLSAIGHHPDAMARDLFRSLHTQLLTLPDGTRVFPAHGAGSACGKQMSIERQSTIGDQRRTNYALQTDDIDEFVGLVTEGQPARPRYFSHDAHRNRELHALFDERDTPRLLSLERVLALQSEGLQMLDTRSADEFALGHLRGSINVGLEGRFAEYVGAVLDPGRPIVLVCDPGTDLEAKIRLSRIGFDDVGGALADPLAVFIDHPEVVGQAKRLAANALSEQFMIDVRGAGETEHGSLPGARLLPLPLLVDELESLDRDQATVVFCAGGYRSSIAASVLRAHGFTDVADVIGGYAAFQMALERPSQ